MIVVQWSCCNEVAGSLLALPIPDGCGIARPLKITQTTGVSLA